MNFMLQNFTKNGSHIPIWLMRQAGRYLPEYMEIRKSASNFLELCYDQNKIVKITLQPVNRFGFDAAIIFSDILLLPHALGWKIEFKETIGPILQQFQTSKDFAHFKHDNKLQVVYDAISKVRSLLPKDVLLIGFAGSPWTVASYLIEGKGKQDFSTSKSFIYKNRKLAKQLIEFLVEETTTHLINQVKAGAEIIQLFDSWSHILSGTEYDEFVIEPTAKIVSNIKGYNKNIPIIGFPRGSGFLYEKYIDSTGVDVISVDQFVPVEFMKKWQDKVFVQGNLDPVTLLTNDGVIKEKTYEILSKVKKGNFIFNLGHGLLPQTKIENIEFLIKYIRQFK